jgi:hypothetical protein
MERILAATFLLGGALGQAERGSAAASADGTLYFFFSPDTPGAPAAAKTAQGLASQGKIKVRPVLLVEDWKTFRKPTAESHLYKTIRELGGRGDPPGVNIGVFDEEGLRLARAWKLTKLPAFVLVAHGKAHVVYGSKLSVDELEECGR